MGFKKRNEKPPWNVLVLTSQCKYSLLWTQCNAMMCLEKNPNYKLLLPKTSDDSQVSPMSARQDNLSSSSLKALPSSCRYMKLPQLTNACQLFKHNDGWTNLRNRMFILMLRVKHSKNKIMSLIMPKVSTAIYFCRPLKALEKVSYRRVCYVWCYCRVVSLVFKCEFSSSCSFFLCLNSWIQRQTREWGTSSIINIDAWLCVMSANDGVRGRKLSARHTLKDGWSLACTLWH